jgi:cysteine synthase A
MAQEDHPISSRIVIGAGKGGTSATFGRYIRYRCLPTRLCLADPEASVFHRHLADRSVRTVAGPPSLIEGIGEMGGEQGSVATLLCDSGERYRSTLLDDAWLGQRGIETGPAEAAMERFFETGIFGQSVQTP